MKKILTLTAVIFTLDVLGQQQIPNNSFENWSGTDTLELDDAWYSLNVITQDYPNYGALRTTDAYDGQYALKLVSGKVDATPFGFPLIDTTAEESLGIFTTQGPIDGIPFTDRPNKLTFYYKYSPGTYPSGIVDTGLLYFKFSGPNGNIGEGIFRFYGNAVTQYTYAEVPITWWNNDTPDTLFFNVSSSTTGFDMLPQNIEEQFTNQIGNELLIDKLDFVYSTGIYDLYVNTELSIYPNPVKNILSIQSTKNLTKSYKIFDATGKLISKGKITNNTIDISNLSDGVYYLTFKDEAKLLKFVKQ